MRGGTKWRVSRFYVPSPQSSVLIPDESSSFVSSLGDQALPALGVGKTQPGTYTRSFTHLSLRFWLVGVTTPPIDEDRESQSGSDAVGGPGVKPRPQDEHFLVDITALEES